MTRSVRTGNRPAVGASLPGVPVGVFRQRLIEESTRRDRTILAVVGLIEATLVATAFVDGLWALLPLIALPVGVVAAPIALRRGARPEYVELTFSLCVTIAMAAAAGLTGGTSSPIVLLLPIGVVMNALRAAPGPVTLCSVVTAVVFLAVSLLKGAHGILSDPLPMASILVMQATVTIGSLALAGAEVRHRRAAIVDPLTGLLNRQGLPARFEELREQALVSGAPITLILLDIDHFKRINDLHGHDVGDSLLREVAGAIRRTLRRFELVYRVGGEEFLVLLPGMVEWEGENVAEQLRLAIDGLELASGVRVTASFGVSRADGAEIDFGRLYHRADQALYEAKRGGRDRVNVSGRQATATGAGPTGRLPV